MSDDFSENIRKPSHWLRILFMVGFIIALYVTGIILLVVVIAQAVFSLVTGGDNRNLRGLGANLTAFVRETLLFLTYNSDRKPFPFAPFPVVDDDDEEAEDPEEDRQEDRQEERDRAPGAAQETAGPASSSMNTESAGPAEPEEAGPEESEEPRTSAPAAPDGTDTDGSDTRDEPRKDEPRKDGGESS